MPRFGMMLGRRGTASKSFTATSASRSPTTSIRSACITPSPAASPAVFAKVFRNTLPGREEWLADDNRIDYIFTKKNSRLKPISADVLFSGQNYRRVSDHPGYLVAFEPE